MKGLIFISYSHEDRVYVDELAHHLTAAGITTWYDYHIATGDRFEQIIKGQIDDCAGVIIVMTPASDESRWVTNELNYAEARNKRILPLLLEGDGFFRFNHLDHADVQGGIMPDRAFLDQLRQLSRTTPVTREAAVPPTPVPSRLPAASAEASPLAEPFPPAEPAAPIGRIARAKLMSERRSRGGLGRKGASAVFGVVLVGVVAMITYFIVSDSSAPKVGDCFVPGDATDERVVACDDPLAVYVVVGVATANGSTTADCTAFPDATAGYRWGNDSDSPLLCIKPA